MCSKTKRAILAQGSEFVSFLVSRAEGRTQRRPNKKVPREETPPVVTSLQRPPTSSCLLPGGVIVNVDRRWSRGAGICGLRLAIRSTDQDDETFRGSLQVPLQGESDTPTQTNVAGVGTGRQSTRAPEAQGNGSTFHPEPRARARSRAGRLITVRAKLLPFLPCPR